MVVLVPLVQGCRREAAGWAGGAGGEEKGLPPSQQLKRSQRAAQPPLRSLGPSHRLGKGSDLTKTHLFCPTPSRSALRAPRGCTRSP